MLWIASVGVTTFSVPLLLEQPQQWSACPLLFMCVNVPMAYTYSVFLFVLD